MGQCDLAIEGLRIPRRLLVMRQRARRVIQRLMGAALPVLRAALADGARHRGIQLLEVRQRRGGLFQKAQGDEAGQELLLGILVARRKARMLDKPQRQARIARRQRIAGLNIAFRPPARRMVPHHRR